jgi:hypothetical protein
MTPKTEYANFGQILVFKLALAIVRPQILPLSEKKPTRLKEILFAKRLRSAKEKKPENGLLFVVSENGNRDGILLVESMGR